MKSSTTPRFWRTYQELPESIRRAARKQFVLWSRDPRHPSLQFKKVGPFWSARVTDDYRALAYEKQGIYYWFWVGTHAEYDRHLHA